MSLIIGFSGPAQSGKSTAQQIVAKWAEDNGLTHEAINFADPLRDLCREINPLLFRTRTNYDRYVTWRTAEEDYGYEGMKQATSARNFMVGLGHGARKFLGEDVWVDAWARAVFNSDADVITASDVRYPNEAFEITSVMKGHLFVISRTNVEPANDTERASLEEIEMAYPHIDVHNNDSLGMVGLEGQVASVVNKLYRGRSAG